MAIGVLWISISVDLVDLPPKALVATWGGASNQTAIQDTKKLRRNGNQ
jgi:hypothetical protein